VRNVIEKQWRIDMKIYEMLNKELKEAMKSKNELARSYIRSIKSKLTEYLVANNLDRSVVPEDYILVTVISLHKKSLEKGIQQLEKGGEKSVNLINEYKNEIQFVEKYLPKLEIDNEVLKYVEEAIKELKVTDMKQAGKVVGHIMKNNKGLDGKMVKELVAKKLGMK